MLRFPNTAIIFFFFSLMLNLTACSEYADSKTPGNKFQGEQNRIEKFSEDKKYKASLYTDSIPISTGKVHRWFLRVTDPEGQPLDNLKIYVHGGMPVHQHGFPTNPRISRYLGQGRYQVDGIKFNMPGDWEIRFNIKQEKKRDRVIYRIRV